MYTCSSLRVYVDVVFSAEKKKKLPDEVIYFDCGKHFTV